MKWNIRRGSKAVAILVFFGILQALPAFAEERHPFDLSKVPMDEGWEDTGIVADTVEPCGKDHVYMGHETVMGEKGKELGVKLRVRSLTIGGEMLSEIEPWQTQDFLGCTPDSRYLLIEKAPPIVNPPIRVDIYDASTMKVVVSFPAGSYLDHYLRLFSPDGRYLLTGGKRSTIRLPDGRTIATVPLLRQFTKGVFSTAWSADGRSAYILTKGIRPQKLVIHNLETDEQRVIELDYGEPDLTGVEVMVHPFTGRVYLRAGAVFDMEVEFREFLFMFDPSDLPEKGTRVALKPKYIRDNFSSLTFGPGGTLFFSLMPDQEADQPQYPAEYNGIFLADADGKVIKRITRSHYDFNPRFMHGSNVLITTRQDTVFNVGLITKDVLYQRKPFSALPSFTTSP